MLNKTANIDLSCMAGSIDGNTNNHLRTTQVRNSFTNRISSPLNSREKQQPRRYCLSPPAKYQNQVFSSHDIEQR